MLTQKILVQAVLFWLLPEDHIQYGIKKEYGIIHTFFYDLQKAVRIHNNPIKANPEDGQLVPLNQLDLTLAQEIIPRIMQAYADHYMAFNVYGRFPHSGELENILFYMAISEQIQRPDGAEPALVFNSQWANPELLADWTEAERWFLKAAATLLRSKLTPIKKWCIQLPTTPLPSRT